MKSWDPRPIKRCSCGKMYTHREWYSLPLCGVGGDEVEKLELRNCSCGSTIAVIIGGDVFDTYVAALRGSRAATRRLGRLRAEQEVPFTEMEWRQIGVFALEKVTS